jgi:xanthine dehydrogenase accessory factor
LLKIRQNFKIVHFCRVLDKAPENVKIWNMNNIYLMIPDKIAGSVPLAIATVIETQGSTPRKSGSSALFDKTGLISGTIGGGVLEGKAQQTARQLLNTKESGIYHFHLDKDISFKQDAICGGQVTILIDASPDEHRTVFEQIIESLHNRTSGVLVTIATGVTDTNKKITRFWVTSGKKNNLPEQYSDICLKDIKSLLSSLNADNFRKLELQVKEEERVLILLEPLFPPAQLIIAGAGHIGKALAHLGKILDFEVTIIDDRVDFANKYNIPDATNIIVDDIGKAIQKLKISSDTYIVIVTRGHDDDAKALRQCINSGAGYIGMIGSKNKIAKMHTNFVQNGWASEGRWSAIHAPVGLDIHSETVEEIAVSIAAQLILIRNSKQPATGTTLTAFGNAKNG